MSPPVPSQWLRHFGAGHARLRTSSLSATFAAMLLASWAMMAAPISRATARHATLATAEATAIDASTSRSAAQQVESPRIIDRGRLRIPPPEVTALSDRQLEERLLGAWWTSYHGVQRIENHPDRTAQLRIEFDWLATLFYGRRMRLELTWSVENGVLTNRIEGGAPQVSVDRLIDDYADNCSYLILELTESSLLLQEVDDPAVFHRWNRIAD